MISLKIQGKEYPYKFTISACKKFKVKFQKDVTKLNPEDVEEMQYLVFYGLEAGAKIEGKELDIDETIFDDMTMEEFLDVVNQANDPEEKKK